MSETIDRLLVLLLALAFPILSSLAYFFTEREGNSSKKIYLRYIILFIIFYLLIFILFIPFILFADFIMSMIDKYFNNQLLYLFVIFPIIYILLWIKIMKKYFSFNDINLFFILSSILTFVMINTTHTRTEGDYYFLMLYYGFFIPLCWILFFINIVVQDNNSRKRKNQNQSDTTTNTKEDSV